MCFTVLLGGLAWRQVLRSSDFVRNEKKQILRRVLQAGPRGDILDRQGRLLVGNRARYSVALYINELRDEFRDEYKKIKNSDPNPVVNSRLRVVQRYLDRANAVLGRHEVLNPKAFNEHFQGNFLQPYTLISDLSPEEYARFNEEMPVTAPMQTATEAVRYYPYGDTAAHALGYVTMDEDLGKTDDRDPDDEAPGEVANDDLKTQPAHVLEGVNGLEYSYDEQLRGVTGSEIWTVDPSGFRSEATPVEQESPRQGASLKTSLDLDLQRVAEKALGNHTGGMAVLDVRTGEVLALVSEPDYNLDDVEPFAIGANHQDISARGAWQNRAVAGVYPPGSTFKLIVSIAGLRAGVLDANTVFTCGTEFQIDKVIFKEHDNEAFGQVDILKALQVSSNVFFYQAGLLVTADRMAAEARRFGLDQQTGVDLPHETPHMLVPDPLWKKLHRPLDGPWSRGDTANMAIGQSYLRVTPLQMACFAASLARDETRTVPTMLYNPTRDHAEVAKGAEPIGMTPAQRALLLEGMERVTTIGTGKLIHNDVPDVRVAAKTGTADFYSNNMHSTAAWVVGFAPLENPQVAFAVVVEGTDPGDHFHGGLTAGPIVGAVLKQYFKGNPGAEVKTQK